jgi:hypothetical protein
MNQYTSVANLNAVMQARYNAIGSNAAYASYLQSQAPGVTQRGSFAFLSDAEVYGVFSNLWSNYYEPAIWRRYPSLQGDPTFGTSREMEAVASLLWNGGPALLGSNLGSALTTSTRAAAWFQIRYQENRGKDPGVARRRYYESQVFGLYATPDQPTLLEAQQAYQMLTSNRAVILPWHRTPLRSRTSL